MACRIVSEDKKLKFFAFDKLKMVNKMVKVSDLNLESFGHRSIHIKTNQQNRLFQNWELYYSIVGQVNTKSTSFHG